MRSPFLRNLINRLKGGENKAAPLVGVAWYREEQWPLLQKVSVDRERMEPTYAGWLKAAQARYDQLSSEGSRLQKVEVDVVDMAAWCSEMGRQVDNAGRAAYVVYRLQDQLAQRLRLNKTPS